MVCLYKHFPFLSVVKILIMANIAAQRIKREFKEVIKSEEVSYGKFVGKADFLIICTLSQVGLG